MVQLLRSSLIQVYLTPATSTKFDSKEIKVVYLRCTRGEVGTTSALAPKIGLLGLSPKKLVMTLPRKPVTGKV
ncbi:hypothetical protein U0070_016287 [Myodes glareolus]|uniref:Ribosomal protein L11 n=1 Tax=Myodes glareolus TaxID=447135 RepID=A0AAW0HED2_MYOGA